MGFPAIGHSNLPVLSEGLVRGRVQVSVFLCVKLLNCEDEAAPRTIHASGQDGSSAAKSDEEWVYWNQWPTVSLGSQQRITVSGRNMGLLPSSFEFLAAAKSEKGLKCVRMIL